MNITGSRVGSNEPTTRQTEIQKQASIMEQSLTYLESVIKEAHGTFAPVLGLIPPEIAEEKAAKEQLCAHAEWLQHQARRIQECATTLQSMTQRCEL